MTRTARLGITIVTGVSLVALSACETGGIQPVDISPRGVQTDVGRYAASIDACALVSEQTQQATAQGLPRANQANLPSTGTFQEDTSCVTVFERTEGGIPGPKRREITVTASRYFSDAAASGEERAGQDFRRSIPPEKIRQSPLADGATGFVYREPTGLPGGQKTDPGSTCYTGLLQDGNLVLRVSYTGVDQTLTATTPADRVLVETEADRLLAEAWRRLPR